MKITKNKDSYLLENDHGSYHFTHAHFEELGESEAIKYAEKEIRKKSESYLDKDIDFKRARDIGFCEYGIKDFCKQLDLDIYKTYKLTHLKSILTTEVLLEYTSECFKLFGKSVLDKFDGPKQFLRDNRTRPVLNFILEYYASERDCHELGIKFALSCIENFEKEFPDDKRPREAIEAKRKFIDGEITEKELRSARSAARSARSAARSAAESAESAAWSAARSAARSAAESAAWSAAWSARSAAWSAVLEYQIEETLKVLIG